MNVGNQFVNFCVGVGVSGHDATNMSHISKDAQKNSTSFDTNFITGVTGEKWSCMKNRPKMEITELKLPGLT